MPVRGLAHWFWKVADGSKTPAVQEPVVPRRFRRSRAPVAPAAASATAHRHQAREKNPAKLCAHDVTIAQRPRFAPAKPASMSARSSSGRSPRRAAHWRR